MLIKRLTVADIEGFVQMLRLFERVFEMKNFILPDRSYLESLVAMDGFVTIAAFRKGEVIGGLTAYTLPSYYTQSSEMYLYDLAVDISYQRQGIGKQLLSALTEYCQKNNCHEFFVQADAVDEHAIEFYRATGGIGEKVMHFSYRQI